MKKMFLFSVFVIGLSTSIDAQLSLTKMIGKNSDKYKLGYGVFSFYDFPFNSSENQSIRLELMDFAFFPGKTYNTTVNTSVGPALATNSKLYFTIKLGYKYIFSETKTGFYVEPSAGYGRVVDLGEDDNTTTIGDVLALAFEAAYSLEVGQKGHVMNFGVKYENDRAGSALSSIGLRISYAFNMFRRKKGY